LPIFHDAARVRAELRDFNFFSEICEKVLVALVGVAIVIGLRSRSVFGSPAFRQVWGIGRALGFMESLPCNVLIEDRITSFQSHVEFQCRTGNDVPIVMAEIALLKRTRIVAD
jgi:hypothetical protein